MNFSRQIFIDLGLISVALLLATLVRAKVRFFQRYLIPNSLVVVSRTPSYSTEPQR